MVKKLAIILLFALIASPFLFKTVAGVAGSWVANSSGSPTPAGLLLHGLVFVILSKIVWKVLGGHRSRYEEEEEYEEEEAAAEEAYAEEDEAAAEEAYEEEEDYEEEDY